MLEFELNGRARIRELLPACVICTDPVDPDDPIWGGIGRLHYGCARWLIFQRPRVPGPMIALDDTVAWETRTGKPRSGVVEDIREDAALVRTAGGKSQWVELGVLRRVVVVQRG